MAVPTKFGAVKNTTGGAFVSQTVNGVVMGNNSTTGPIASGLSLLDAATLNSESISVTLPKEQSSGLYTTKKPLSSGVFAYFSSDNYVIAKVSETLSGVSKNNILFMDAPSLQKNIHSFEGDLGVKMLSAWTSLRFSWTGKLANGNSINSRKRWMNADGTAVATPATLSGTNMWDLTDGNASNKAVDDAATPTRAIPGEFVLKVDFVTAGLAGGNFFDYKPITGV